MKTKAVLISTVCVTILWFLLGFLWYGLMGMSDKHALIEGSMKEQPNMPLLILGILITAFFFCYIYSKWARGVHNAGHGFQYGALMGLMAGFGMGILWYATSNLMSLNGVLIDAVFRVVEWGLGGAVASLCYAKFAGSD